MHPQFDIGTLGLGRIEPLDRFVDRRDIFREVADRDSAELIAGGELRSLKSACQ